MKRLPKSVWIPGLLGLMLLLAGDLYNSFGFLMCVVGGLTLVAAWLLALKHLSKNESLKIRKATKAVKILTLTALSMVLLSFFIIEGLILAHDDGTENPNANTLIVLGAGLHGDQPSLTLLSRLEVALDYLNTHPDAVAILTGGQGAGESMTEAAAMARWLTYRGVSADRLYLEEQATDTRENLRFSKAILDENDLPGPVAVISNSFHLYRAEILAGQAGLEEIQTLPATVPKVPLRWLTASVYLREYCSILLMLARSIL